MIKNITKKVKEAISADTLWSVNAFFYFIEMLNNKGYETSYSEGEEYCATLLHSGIMIGYIWQKYPLIFIREDHAQDMKILTNGLNYIVVIKSKDLESQQFAMDMGEDLIYRIAYGMHSMPQPSS